MSNGNATLTLTADERAVRDVLLEAIAAWADGDAAAFAACYSDGATVAVPGEFLTGSAEIGRHMAGRFAGPLKGTTIVDNPHSVRIVGHDAAIITSLAGIAMPGESNVPDEQLQRATWVLARHGGRWAIEAYTICPRSTAA